MSGILIRTVQESDAADIAGIYSYYVENTVITFETQAPGPDEMAARIRHLQPDYPYLVLLEQGVLLGYAYAGPWKNRAAFLHTAETSIYLSRQAQGRGLGVQLYQALIQSAAEAGLHCLISGIALPNEGSEALHRKLGFSPCGCMREVGWKLQRYIDIAYYQLILQDRTSKGL
ncbi:N-acetyltransferase family protein [Spirochaeta dissipatitropha]